MYWSYGYCRLELVSTEDQTKILNSSYRPYNKDIPSKVKFRVWISGRPGIILMLHVRCVLLGCLFSWRMNN